MLKVQEEFSSESLAQEVMDDGLALLRLAKSVENRQGRVTIKEVLTACDVMVQARAVEQFEERGQQ